MLTGDHKAIARETCRQLGLGDVILGPDGLPGLDDDGRPPPDLANYAPLILGADGFAQARARGREEAAQWLRCEEPPPRPYFCCSPARFSLSARPVCLSLRPSAHPLCPVLRCSPSTSS